MKPTNKPARDAHGRFLPRTAPKARRVTRTPGPLPANAAQLWAATLPSASALAIAEERVRRERRPVVPVAPVAVLSYMPEPAERQWPWALASVASVLMLVAGCALLAL